jgi:hypothetical protein
MNNHYLIEVTKVQKFFVSIEAETPEQVIEEALTQRDRIAESMPPEITKIQVKQLDTR